MRMKACIAHDLLFVVHVVLSDNMSLGVDTSTAVLMRDSTGILEKRQERADRRAAIHRRNVLGLLPEKKPTPRKRLGKKAAKKKLSLIHI